jgi:predicted component of type VI protein secretion system
MLVVLQATSNGTRTRRIQLRANQIVKVGRSEWADLSFSDDSSMAEVQLEIRSTSDGCMVRSLSAECPTFVNGQEVQTAALHDGYQIRAGRTQILVRIDGERFSPQSTIEVPPPAEPSEVEQPSAPSLAPAPLSLIATCAFLEFADEFAAPAANAKSADALIAHLIEKKEYLSALKLRAFLLGKREAVWWGCLCIRDELDEPLPPVQQQAVKAAAMWVGEPDESHRRAAEQHAAVAKYSGAGATLALSAFWSGGSIAPEGNPDVVPDERLTSQGVAAALISAAYFGDGRKAPGRIDRFLAKGKEIADATIQVPEGTVDW